MEMRKLGRTGLQVSRYGLGAMTFGKESDEGQSKQILNEYLEAGGNLVDTADGYNGGASESIIGQVLGSRRQKVLLSTKVRFATGDGPNDRGASRRHILDSVRGSLQRLKTDWIDIYQIHCWDPGTPQEETMSTLNDLVRQGVVRYVGVSNYAARHVAKAREIAAVRNWESVSVLQAQLSLLSRGAERELLPLCREEGMGFLAWSPLGGGVLTGKYADTKTFPVNSRAWDSARRGSPTMKNRMTLENFATLDQIKMLANEADQSVSGLALSWVADLPGVSSTLIGARSVEQLRKNLSDGSSQLESAIRGKMDSMTALRPEYPHDFIEYSAGV